MAARRMRSAFVAAGLLACGCGTTEHPPPLSEAALVEAQTFPYYPIYWVGPRFEGRQLAAVDGTKSYSTTIGDSVYYGDCVTNKGLLGGGGSCRLPLQVTTVIYGRHSNTPLGPQSNTLIRGVPAAIYDEGSSIEVYTRPHLDRHLLRHPGGCLRAAQAVRTLNAPGTPSGELSPPVYCPGLWGPASAQIQRSCTASPAAPARRPRPHWRQPNG